MNIICKFFTGIDQILMDSSTSYSKKTSKKIYVIQKVELIVDWPD